MSYPDPSFEQSRHAGSVGEVTPAAESAPAAQSAPAAESVTLAAAHTKAQSQLELIQQLIRAESPSNDAGKLAECAQILRTELRERFGQEPETLRVDGLEHVLLDFGPAEHQVLILCHYDTVWPLGSWGADPVSIAGGVLRGPGSFDMKTGLVQAVTALEILRDSGQSLAGIRLLLTADEEVGSTTSRQYIEHYAKGCDAALILEASADGGRVKTGRKGVGMYQLMAHGRAAHAGLEPEKGVNASIEVAHQILAIAALNNPAAGTSVTPTVLSAGHTTNTVPDQAVLRVDVRAWTEAEMQRVDKGMHALAPVLAEATLTLDGGPNRPPFEPPLAQGLYGLAESVAQSLGLEPLGAAQVGGGSDGNFTAAVGVPTLDGLGAVGGGAHAPGEHAELTKIPERTALLAAMLQRILAGGVGPDSQESAQ